MPGWKGLVPMVAQDKALVGFYLFIFSFSVGNESL